MIEKILERLEEVKTKRFVSGFTNNLYELGACHAMDIAKEVVKEVAKEYGKDTNVRSNGWIPCSERLPENDFEDVLVWFEYFRYGDYQRPYQMHGISYTFHGEWSGIVNGTSGWQQLRVIAWQPLPTPYQKGE